MSRLPGSFYRSEEVADVARALIGQLLVTDFSGHKTTGVITETEAYHQSEKACHAYNGRYTKRTKVLFEPGGLSYIYLCYGIHNLFNITTGKRGEASAVLIRAIEPVDGIPKMLERRAIQKLHYRISSGPGRLAQALGLTLESNYKSLINSSDIWVERFRNISDNQIVVSPRIGVEYADDDALLPWRFHLKQTKWVSKG